MLRRYLQVLALVAIGVLPVAFSGCNNTTSASGRDDVAAVVNGKEIKMEDLDHAIERQYKSNGQQVPQMSPVEQAGVRLQALEAMISKEVMYQKAQEEKVNVTDPDVEQAYAQQKQQGGVSEEEWQKQLKEIGISEQEAKEEIRKTLAIDKLQKQVSAKVKNPTDKEITDFFNSNPDQFKLGRAVNLSVIGIAPQSNSSGDVSVGAEAAKAKINSISATLKSGADFATIARTQSQHESAARGGDVGWLGEDQVKGTFGDALAARFFSMTEGQITEPIQVKNVWFIFKLTAKRTQEQKLTVDDTTVRQQISQGLLNQRQQVVLGALQTDAMNGARIENYLAKRIIDNPDNFGSSRQSGLAAKPADTKPADAKPAGK